MERIEIPKDCLLCDICNKQVSDQKFVALEDLSWYEGWLYCRDCEKEYHSEETEQVLIRNIFEGENMSKTDLAKPIVMESF
jgi:hypothetical protein|tara:strand:+ start:817 stop:1059 length:243 start_codon:yes stop_codon:yes gene_type:complete